MESIERWWCSGKRARVRLGGADRAIFVRRMGSGPSMTMLHGFPSSSHDWARVAPELAERYALLMPDFLGFGASEKPAEHAYSLHEQADLVEALWAWSGIASTVLVAHDYGVSVTQELLARRAEAALCVDVVAVHLLNGGLYPDLHRPPASALELLDPERGRKISARITEDLFAMSLKSTFAKGFDAAGDNAGIWRATSRGGGQAITYRLMRYITDRRAHEQRWVGALERTDVSLAFVWGMLDPVSGAHMAQRIRERIPDAPFLALEDVCHWPSLEAPERVLASILHPSAP